jgi:hypothetical protein
VFLTAPERRKIVVLSGDSRIDAAVPLDDTLGAALRTLGYDLEPGRHALLDRAGAQISLDAVGGDLQDGALFSIVDLQLAGTAGGGAAPVAAPVRDDKGAVWWMLGTVAVVIAAVALLDAGITGTLAGLGERIMGSVVLAAGAVASAVFWAMRRPRDVTSEALAMLAPLALAFAAGVVAIDPHLEASVHLAVLTGLLAAGALALLLATLVDALRLRSAAGAAAIILLGLAGIWGITLLVGMDSASAAALSAGAVPLGMRFLPSTLVNVADGHHIDYKHFMSSRWTVRGVIPDSPGRIAMSEVRDVVDASSARLVTGVVLLSVVAALFLPLAFTRPLAPGPFVLGGTIGLVCTLALALILVARHYTSPVLRWVPRAAAAIVVLVAVIGVSTMFAESAVLILAGVLLVIGIGAAAALVPIGRGARSLVWSRTADFFEWISVVLSFPAALLAADALSIVRGMMST